MKILVSGAHGLVGTALVPHLRREGHDVRTLTRRKSADIYWDPATGHLDQGALGHWEGPEAMIHLAGENIASRRWTKNQKHRIRESRVEATEKLCPSLKPSIFIGASAVGFYGNRADEILTEKSPPGADFLSEVCVAWENAANPLVNSGARVIHLRFGMILTRDGGALAKMLPLFRLGLGGRLGSGRQWISWIALDDVVRVIDFCLAALPLHGPCNAVAPNPVTNREFTQALAIALHRPAILPVPAFALGLALGEMADALLLTSQRAVPTRLESLGFAFRCPTLEGAFAAL